MKRWCVRFKDRSPDAAELTFLAKEFYRDLSEERVTGDEFAAADREVCKRNRFFPVMADILEAAERYRAEKRAEKQRQPIALPDDLTDYEIEQNKRRMAILVRQLSGELSVDEALEQQSKI